MPGLPSTCISKSRAWLECSLHYRSRSRPAIPELAPEGRIGAFQITAEHRPDPHRVLVESITRFKGLERDVVVMAGLREVEYVNFGPLLCVGASRARAHLVVIGTPEVLERFG